MLDADSLALRTATELDAALVAVAAQAPEGLGPPDIDSLLSVSDTRVKVLSVSPVQADEGGVDVLVRMQSFAAQPITVALRCGLPLTGAWPAGFLGDIAGSMSGGGAVSVELPRLGIAAVVLRLGAA